VSYTVRRGEHCQGKRTNRGLRAAGGEFGFRKILVFTISEKPKSASVDVICRGRFRFDRPGFRPELQVFGQSIADRRSLFMSPLVTSWPDIADPFDVASRVRIQLFGTVDSFLLRIGDGARAIGIGLQYFVLAVVPALDEEFVPVRHFTLPSQHTVNVGMAGCRCNSR